MLGESRGVWRPRIKLDGFDKATISRFMIKFFAKDNLEIPTLRKICSEALLILGFPQPIILILCAKAVFVRLKKMQKKKKKCVAISERLYVASWQEYLRKI